MSRILIFEFVCGGGCYAFPAFGSPAGPLFDEGRQMLQALLDEFKEFAELAERAELTDRSDWEAIVPLDSRVSVPALHCGHAQSRIITHADDLTKLIHQSWNSSDRMLFVAPEIEDSLHHFVDSFTGHSNLLISPNRQVVELCSDKWTTFQWLRTNQIPTPETFICDSITTAEEVKCFRNRPVVIKPRLGAGSLDVTQQESAASAVAQWQLEPPAIEPNNYLIQQFAPGISASIAMVRSDQGDHFYPAMRHQLEPGTFQIKSFERLADDDFHDRATRLVELVAKSLPPFRGYLGVDLVLGPATDGTEDFVIEVNPRLTTSFCTARRLTDFNLFQILLG